jgi:CNT family concentrative nucleoside transporter
MGDITETREVKEGHANDRASDKASDKARDEGPELVPYRSADEDIEAGQAREKKTGSPQLEPYQDGNSESRVGSVRNGNERSGRRWEFSIVWLYREYRPVFHLVFGLLMTA